MSDVNDSPHVPGDPMAAARLATGAPRLKRFYTDVGLAREDAGHVLALHVLTLDGRSARTPARAPLALPNAAFGEAVAAEWRAVETDIDPAAMPLTRLANVAIDGVSRQMEEVRDEIVKYAQSDLVCYRAGEPDSLVAAQAAAWDPLLRFAETELGARLVQAQGITFVDQPQDAMDALARAVDQVDSPFALAALHVMTTLTGSAVIALAASRGVLDAGSAWHAAHLDEIHQEERWGTDAEALARRALRKRDFDAAFLACRLVASGSGSCG